MKKYVRPDVFVTEFQPNEAIAGNCTWNDTGSTSTTWPEQEITCLRSGSSTKESIFGDTSTCNMVACGSIVIPTTGSYTIAQLNALGLHINDNGGGGGKGSKPGSSGTTYDFTEGQTVLCWNAGDHFGVATPKIEKLFNMSY